MPKGTNSMRIFCRVVLWWALLLPISAFAQGTNQTIFTNTTSASVGATNAIFGSVSTRIGPQTIHINDLGLCTLAPPPYPTCDPPSGTGTVADPFVYTCSSIPISNCTSGTTFALAEGQVDIDFHLHTETAGAVVSAAAPVPLNPWVPIGSALGVALLAVAWQLRRRRN